MADFRYGPVELLLVGFEGDHPDPAVMQALADQLESGHIRLLDFVLVSRSADGEVTITDVEDIGGGFADIDLGAAGLTGEDDIAELADLIEPGSSAAVVALELVWATELASKLAASGGAVISTERIPAPIVNAIVDAAENEGE